jgi:WD40 repeat protein
VATQKPVKKDYFAETGANQFFHTATWSPKGKFVAAACDGGGVRVWDATTGALAHKLEAKFTVHRTRFAFSADDKLVLVSSWPDGLFKVFDTETGKEQNAVKAPAGQTAPEYVQFAREMGRVAWVVQKQQYQPGRAVTVADATGTELKTFDLAAPSMSLLMSNDGKRLAVGGQDGSLRVYEAETGKLDHTMLGAWSPVFRTVYANGGKVLRTVHTNGTVNDFDADTGKPLKERALALKGELPVSASADGKFFVTATDAGAFTVWNLDTGEAGAKPKAALFVYREPGGGPFGGDEPFPLPPPPLPVKDGAFPPPPPGGGAFPPPPPFRQPGPPQFFGAFSADGKLFVAVTGKEEGTVTAFDVTTGEEKYSVKSPKGATAVAPSADGAHVFVGYGRGAPGEDKEAVAIRRFEVKSGKEVQTWKATAGEKRANLQFTRSEVSELHALADGVTLVAVDSQLYGFWPPPPGAPGRPGFGPPGQRFAAVRVINLPGREKDRTIDLGAGGQLLATDGKSVALVTTDARDPNKPATVVKVVGAGGAVKGLAVATGHNHGADEKQRGVTFRPGGTDLAVRTGDGTVLVIDASNLKDEK